MLNELNPDLGISVVMPTYRQAGFINRAIRSLINQSFTNWELIIINDGTDDNTLEMIQHYFTDNNIHYLVNESNTGLGACLNKGIELANFSYIAYLPSDDFYLKNHLQTLFEKINIEKDVILAYSGIRYQNNYNVNNNICPEAKGKISKISLQLVQVLHKKNQERWIERKELVSDDLQRLFWQKLTDKGLFLPTGQVSCEWTDHPKQHHKIISRQYGGGISIYRQHYKVKQALKFVTSAGDTIDELEYYNKFESKTKAT